MTGIEPGGADSEDASESPAVGAQDDTADQTAEDALDGAADEARRRKMRRWGRRLVILGFGTLLLVSLAWLAVSALLARKEVTAIKADMTTLRSSVSAGDVDSAKATANDLAAHAHRAAQLTAGPVWSITGAIPYVGSPFKSVQALTEVADQLGRSVLPDLIEASNELDPNQLRSGASGINVAKVAAAAPLVHRSVLLLQDASNRVNALPPKTWLSSVDDARASVITSLDSLHGGLAGLDRATSIMPSMLGQKGEKRYFIGIMNEAESRGLGGIPGAFVIATFNNGVASFDHYGSDDELKNVDSGVKLGAEYDERYANSDSTKFFLNSTISPNFPYVGQIWAATWEKATGQHIDGAIAVDPTALSYFLDVTGPATAPDGMKVGSDNIVALTQSTLYSKFGFYDQADRKAYLLDIASAVDGHILQSQSRAADLVKAAFKAADERRLLIWSADPAAEKVLQTTSFAGVIPTTPNPYAGLVVTNGAADKLDYYLDRSLTWTRTGCGSTRDVTVTIKLTNGAPKSGLPRYVTTRYDTNAAGKPPGDQRLQAVYYGTSGGGLASVTVDGKPSVVIPASELGHPTYFMDLEIPAGATKTIVLKLVEPAGSGAPTLLEQPLVRPMTTTVNDAKCG
ncbi:uncharacterized protein DUF4012 [Jatrophihabitans sp. GAS493]|uniref:DUF4012 domain-containing protein n=1 Tax=Jatrophihabitans sp. GAS493 TaxID=1907575 RepID=UPI000BB771DD|nr:DUF4012 domain-containing protein [Jatrophihabitans sp. GAS493]SOD74712.1 uncharacterized protein DUF4012 [Jatrophihabitans sp. GAS493]